MIYRKITPPLKKMSDYESKYSMGEEEESELEEDVYEEENQYDDDTIIENNNNRNMTQGASTDYYDFNDYEDADDEGQAETYDNPPTSLKSYLML